MKIIALMNPGNSEKPLVPAFHSNRLGFRHTGINRAWLSPSSQSK